MCRPRNKIYLTTNSFAYCTQPLVETAKYFGIRPYGAFFEIDRDAIVKSLLEKLMIIIPVVLIILGCFDVISYTQMMMLTGATVKRTSKLHHADQIK